MALINAEAPDRISLDCSRFLNETFVCKCIVYQVTATLAIKEELWLKKKVNTIIVGSLSISLTRHEKNKTAPLFSQIL